MSNFPQLQFMLAAEIQKQRLRNELEPLEMQEVKRRQFVKMQRKRFDFIRPLRNKQTSRRHTQRLQRKTPAVTR